jgi:cytidylate kinase
MTREVSPLKQAEDAVLVDTSDLSIDEVTERILKIVEEKA